MRIAAEWYWEGMRGQISRYVKESTICQKAKASCSQPVGLLQPLPIPTQVWEHVTMDIIEGLPLSKGVDTVLVVID